MFKTRLLSGIVLVILALVTIMTGGWLLLGVLAVLAVIAFAELSKATGIHTAEKKANGLEIAGIFLILLYYAVLGGLSQISLYGDAQPMLIVAVAMTVFAAFMLFMFVYVLSFPKFKASQIMSAFFSFLYAPVLLSFLYLTRSMEDGKYIVWMILISSWGCDTCAYCVGMLLGKHKLAPKLSPKKSVEGAVGGIVGAALLGFLYGHFVLESFLPYGVAAAFAVLGAAGAVVSQIGDLAASGIKRDHDIKDYGKLIPGHGGVMDRFDSVIFTAPMIYFLALFLL